MCQCYLFSYYYNCNYSTLIHKIEFAIITQLHILTCKALHTWNYNLIITCYAMSLSSILQQLLVHHFHSMIMMRQMSLLLLDDVSLLNIIVSASITPFLHRSFNCHPFQGPYMCPWTEHICVHPAADLLPCTIKVSYSGADATCVTSHAASHMLPAGLLQAAARTCYAYFNVLAARLLAATSLQPVCF